METFPKHFNRACQTFTGVFRAACVYQGFRTTDWKVATNIQSFIHLVVCLTTGPKPIPKPALRIGQPGDSSFKWEYPLPSLGLPVASYVFFLFFLSLLSPFYLSFNNFCRMQFLRKMWPIQLAFRLLISCRIFLCSLLSNTSSFLTWSVQLIFSILLQNHSMWLWWIKTRLSFAVC